MLSFYNTIDCKNMFKQPLGNKLPEIGDVTNCSRAKATTKFQKCNNCTVYENKPKTSIEVEQMTEP